MEKIEKVKDYVDDLLNKDKSGHGMDHINRVLKLSLLFAEKEKANKDIVTLIALLHDVDDHKLFGKENAEKLTNARRIMDDCNIESNIQKEVLEALDTIGYSKRLKGKCPISLEGKVVSDADMCDALGANGILRTYAYNLKIDNPFFDRNSFPTIDMSAEEYSNKKVSTCVNHIFEKILKLKGLMLTDSGREEAGRREKITIDFLYHLFEEEDALDWKEYLDNYLKMRDDKN